MRETTENKTRGIKKSLIAKYISPDLYVELFKVTMLANVNNNNRGLMIENLLTKFNVPWTRLGTGTNRIGVLIDGYVFKFALDKDGMIDNRREMLYTKDLQPYVIKVYECVPNGIVAVSEYVNSFSISDYHNPENRAQMRKILEEISSMFFIGDVGFSTDNYGNWGVRSDGNICMLDFAYVYSSSYKTFLCGCDDSTLLVYDRDYVNLVCPRCGRKYTFGQIRKRITRKVQEEEIGDIRRLSYNIHNEEEEVELVPEFEPEVKTKKHENKKESNLKKVRKFEKMEKKRKTGIRIFLPRDFTKQ